MTQAVREQFPNDLLACLELHTYSSLDTSFIHTFANRLDHTDIAAVFIDYDSRKSKGKSHFEEDTIRNALQVSYVFYDKETLQAGFKNLQHQ